MLSFEPAWMDTRSSTGNARQKQLPQSTSVSQEISPYKRRRVVAMVCGHSSNKRARCPLLQDRCRGNNSEELRSSSSSLRNSGLPTKSLLKLHSSRDWCLENPWVQGCSGNRTMGTSYFKISKLHNSAVKYEVYFRKPLTSNPLSKTSGGIASNSK